MDINQLDHQHQHYCTNSSITTRENTRSWRIVNWGKGSRGPPPLLLPSPLFNQFIRVLLVFIVVPFVVFKNISARNHKARGECQERDLTIVESHHSTSHSFLSVSSMFFFTVFLCATVCGVCYLFFYKASSSSSFIFLMLVFFFQIFCLLKKNENLKLK